ncbi:ADP ribosylation factor-like 4 isoform 2-T2 [Glossina fuscipes fuscipes]
MIRAIPCDICEVCNVVESAEHLIFRCHRLDGIRDSFSFFKLYGCLLDLFAAKNIQGTAGRAKGIHFLIWDVGGQEKLRPLWRSYTRCTDGILFVVDSVDVERMEEAKMELLRMAKCPDNQGVPVLIFANKQDLPGAREPKELEKLLGLYELATPALQYTSLGKASSSTGNVVSFNNSNTINRIPTTEIKSNFASESSTQFNNMSLQGYENNINCSISRITRDLSITLPAISTSLSSSLEEASVLSGSSSMNREKALSAQNPSNLIFQSSPSSLVTSPTSTIPTGGASAILLPQKLTLSAASTSVQLKNNSGCTSSVTQYKGWHIQPACAITGEGLQEGLEALYDMILKKRKLHKVYKKKTIITQIKH